MFSELEELKNKIFSGEYDNPTQEFERVKKQREEMYKPKLLIDVNLEQSQQREREIQRERERDVERQNLKDRERAQKERYVLAQASRELASLNAEPIDSTDSSNDDNSPRNNKYVVLMISISFLLFLSHILFAFALSIFAEFLFVLFLIQ